MLHCTHFHIESWHFNLYWRTLSRAPDCKTIKLLTFSHLISCFRQYDILAKARTRM